MRARLRSILATLNRHLLRLERNISVHPTSRVAFSAMLDASAGGSIVIGARCDIGEGAVLDSHGGAIAIGDDCSVNPYAVLYGQGGLTIGSGVRIAAHAVLVPANHGIDRDLPIFRQPQTKRGIVVEDDVWIGSGARILDGVTLAIGSVIGAGAVVTRSTEPYSINLGVPARQVGTRPRAAEAGAERREWA
jgi:acetyltransferase-like isoleucine patch superfamily enzyme